MQIASSLVASRSLFNVFLWFIIDSDILHFRLLKIISFIVFTRQMEKQRLTCGTGKTTIWNSKKCENGHRYLISFQSQIMNQRLLTHSSADHRSYTRILRRQSFCVGSLSTEVLAHFDAWDPNKSFRPRQVLPQVKIPKLRLTVSKF